VSNKNEAYKTLNFVPDIPGTPTFWMPYVYVVSTGQTYVPYPEANSDGFRHFQVVRGTEYTYLYMEDLPGGGDKDFNDLIVRISAPK
jgi:hypothetical protein